MSPTGTGGAAAYLLWYVAMSSSPLYLRKDVPEEDVQQLCRACDGEYASFS